MNIEQGLNDCVVRSAVQICTEQQRERDSKFTETSEGPQMMQFFLMKHYEKSYVLAV